MTTHRCAGAFFISKCKRVGNQSISMLQRKHTVNPTSLTINQREGNMTNSDMIAWLLKRLKINPKDMATFVASSYGRRFLDSHGGAYDTLAQTPFFQALKNQGNPTKYLLEAGGYFLSAFLNQRIGETTPLRKIIGEISEDTMSEMFKRLVNGDSPGKILIENSNRISDPAEKNILVVLIMLSEEKLKPFVEELLAVPDYDDRMAIIKHLLDLMPEEIIKLASLATKTRQSVFELFKKPAAPEKKPGILTLISTDINEGLDLIHEKLQKAKQKREARKC